MIKNFGDFLNENINENNILKDIYSRRNDDEFKEHLKNNGIDTPDLYEFEFFLNSEKALYIEDDMVSFHDLSDDIEHLIGSNPVILYHFTSSKYRSSIEEDGLVVGKNKTNPDSNSYSGVYLTTATTGAEIDGYKHHIRQVGGDIILIKLKLYLNEIEPDPDDSDLHSGRTQFITDDIKKERIIDIDETY